MNHSVRLDMLEARLDRFEAKVAALRVQHGPLTPEDAGHIARWEAAIAEGREEIAFQRSWPDPSDPGQPPGGGR